MSKVALSGNASGTGTFTIASPNSNTDRTLTLPDQTGTLLTGSGAISVNASAPVPSVSVNSSGNVGIGTSSPSGRVSTAVPDGATSAFYAERTGGAPSTLSLDFANAIANWYASSAMTFSTAGSERARIDSSGKLLVGTTTGIEALTVNGYASFQGQFPVSGAISTINTNCSGGSYYGIMVKNISGSNSQAMTFVNSSNGFVGTIVLSSSTTTYNTSSDYRLKENIQPMVGALAQVQQLKPCTYKWKVDGSDGQGFIAHELQAVCPDAVTGEKDAVNEDGSIKPQGIDTSFLVATLTAAIQELKAIVDAQGAEIAALKGQA